MIIATFGPRTGWSGKSIRFVNEVLTLEGFGPISFQDLEEYDRRGHLIWPFEGMRVWAAKSADAEKKGQATGGIKLACGRVLGDRPPRSTPQGEAPRR